MSSVRETGIALFVARIAARTQLSDEERNALLALPAESATVRSNHDLVRLGEIVDRTCLVVDGLMGRFGQTRDGQRQISALYIPGDMPDLHSFVVPRSNWALMTLPKTTVLRVPHEAHDIAVRAVVTEA